MPLSVCTQHIGNAGKECPALLKGGLSDRMAASAVYSLSETFAHDPSFLPNQLDKNAALCPTGDERGHVIPF